MRVHHCWDQLLLHRIGRLKPTNLERVVVVLLLLVPAGEGRVS